MSRRYKKRYYAISSETTEMPSRRNSLKDKSPVTIIDALITTSGFQMAIDQLNSKDLAQARPTSKRSHSSLSKYLSSRGLNYEQLKLFRFMGGATPAKAKIVLLSYQESNFDMNACALFQKKAVSETEQQRYDQIYYDYVDLYKRLRELYDPKKRVSHHKKDFFENLRFISAIRLTKTREQAAMILSVPLETVTQFVIKHEMSVFSGRLNIESEENVSIESEENLNRPAKENLNIHPKPAFVRTYNTRSHKKRTWSFSSDDDTYLSEFSQSRQDTPKNVSQMNLLTRESLSHLGNQVITNKTGSVLSSASCFSFFSHSDDCCDDEISEASIKSFDIGNLNRDFGAR